jgi:paraquat-inducible protein B
VDLERDASAEEDHLFRLYDSYENALQKEYTLKQNWLLDFEGSVRGLKPGAPVEFKGIRVGKVLEGRLQFGKKASDIYISVLIETEPQRLIDKAAVPGDEDHRKFYDSLVAQGLRAQLKTGSLLTGQRFVDLDFHPSADPQKIIWEGQHPNFPTVQTTSEEILTVINNVANKLEDFPVQQIGRDLQAIVKNVKKVTQQFSSTEVKSIVSNVNDITGQVRDSDLGAFIANLNQTIEGIGLLVNSMNTAVDTEFESMMVQAQETLLALEKILSTDSTLNQEATRALKEVADAAGRIRALADYLERHPDSLIRGKGE